MNKREMLRFFAVTFFVCGLFALDIFSWPASKSVDGREKITETASGRLLFHVMGALAEFERTCVERQAGVALDT